MRLTLRWLWEYWARILRPNVLMTLRTSAADAGITRIVVTTNDYTVNQNFDRATVVLPAMQGPDVATPVTLAFLNSL